MLFMSDCDNCGNSEERCFTDTWTGVSLCVHCLWPILGSVTGSPATEGDNLKALLNNDGRKQDAA